MKQSLLLVLIVVLVSACTNKNMYKISGTIENGADKVLYIQKMDLNETTTIDSVKLNKKGQFSFKGDRLMEPTFFLLKFNDSNYLTLLADSVENIEVSADAANLEESYQLMNSYGSVYVQIFNRKMRKLNIEMERIIVDYKTSDKQGKEELVKEYNQLITEHKTYVGQFIMDNPRSYAGYYALFQRLNDNSQVMNVMDKQDQVYFSTLATSLKVYYPHSERAKHLESFVLNVISQQKQAKMKEYLMNNATAGFPDIEEADVKGNKIKLSSLKGKTVLLSFWASWDEASRKENNHLKKMYKKYNNKGFEIYQVSLDRSKVLWESAIVNDELPWINVSDLRYTESHPARLYNVQNLPANYLISAEGEIIGKNLFGNRLSDKLSELY
ncbi:AhpC/TSA family protein [Marinilabiliaceae bacterium N1Y90]|nr:AhpC/TSA family protein [Marinilabiliaceae bacterium N1Y90]